MASSSDWSGRRWLAGLALLAAALVVGGCCTSSLLMKSCSPTDCLLLTPAKTLNACDPPRKPVSHPVVVRVYELKKVEAFQDAEFDVLWDQAAIAGDLAGAVKEYTLAPGGEPLALMLPRPAGTVAIGVVAAFCRLDSGCWRKTITLDKRAADLKFDLDATCLKLTP